ncbi:flagella basal body P-ring formation protein FlgA [Mariprofundus ferrinatatus]|uniref:Flagella basal body P-ring formation protein FlgA n=1 Tax=Mariprofundus ferrinatatus TaxID=1921087 RepID=A0A2K8L6I6_9PROT|nr:flagellar basal body P-ring formation chaperone FlgA [Mariprofundus ferrinatatus]ATX82945.1 flagella basal body P-ring formation protein FlgA [Mariprofundus ferrinatatus]
MLRNALSALFLLFMLPAVAGAGPDSAMQDSIRNYFAQGVFLKGARAELVEVLHWPDATGELRWRMPEHKNHPDRISLIAEQGHGQSLKRWYVPVRLNWWTKTVIAKKDLPVRTRLSAEMLDIARTNIAGHSGSWWNKYEGLTGTMLTRPLKAGDAIYASYVRRPKLISRGDQVTMIASYGDLKVTAVGKALRSAGMGDRVSIRNLKSKQVVQGVVVSASTVQVITGETL